MAAASKVIQPGENTDWWHLVDTDNQQRAPCKAGEQKEQLPSRPVHLRRHIRRLDQLMQATQMRWQDEAARLSTPLAYALHVRLKSALVQRVLVPVLLCSVALTSAAAGAPESMVPSSTAAAADPVPQQPQVLQRARCPFCLCSAS